MVIDWLAASERIPGGDDGVRELAAMMIEECPRLLDAIKRGLAAGDASRVRLDAHTLGGSARHFAARPVSGAAFAIEALARENDLRGVRAAVPDLEQHVQALLLALADGPPAGEAKHPRTGDFPDARVWKEDDASESDGGSPPEEVM